MSYTKPRLWHRFTLAVSACAGMLAAPSIPVVSVLGASLLFSGLSQQCIAATIYFVDGTSGSDANTGLTLAQSLKTINALPALANGDTVYLAGKLRSNAALFTGAATGGAATLNCNALSNVIIAQMPGGTQAEMRGDTQLVQTGWTASGNAWQLTLTGAPALAPDDAAGNWDGRIDSNGHHYGHLVPQTTLASVTGATGAIGRYHYNTATKVFTVYLGTDNPNTCGYPVSVCWVPAEATQEAAIRFDGGANNTVSGINFALYPTLGATGQTGWAVIFKSSPNGLAFNCFARDMGAHGFGSYASTGSASGCYMVNCTTHSGRSGGAGAFIHYTTSALNLTARNTNCLADCYQYLGTDGATRLAGEAAMDAFTGAVFLAHADSGTPVQDILHTGCTAAYYQDPAENYLAFSASNTAAVGSGSTWSSYPVRCDLCQILFSNQEYYTTGVVAFRRSKIHQTRQLAEGGSGTRGAISLWTAASDGTMCFEACEFIFDLSNTTGQTRAFSVQSNSGNSYIHFSNCSMHNVSASFGDLQYFFDYFTVNANAYRVYRCAISHLTSSTGAALCWADSTTTTANHTFVNCAYWRINDGSARWSQNASLDTAAEFTNTSTGADTSGLVLSAAPFVNAPTDLGLTSASPLWSVRAASVLFPPTYGINNPYARFVGAYQYYSTSPPAADGGGGSSSGGGFRRARGRHR